MHKVSKKQMKQLRSVWRTLERTNAPPRRKKHSRQINIAMERAKWQRR